LCLVLLLEIFMSDDELLMQCLDDLEWSRDMLNLDEEKYGKNLLKTIEDLRTRLSVEPFDLSES